MTTINEEKNMRRAGILMPIFSLTDDFGIGTIGEKAYEFIDFIASCNLKIWQVLPITPTGFGDSPYQSCSAYALNHYFIDLKMMVSRGLLTLGEIWQANLTSPNGRVDYGRMFAQKAELLKIAYSRYNDLEGKFEEFCKDEKYHEYAIFMALKEKNGFKQWTEWGEYANYDEQKIVEFEKENIDLIKFWQFTQYVFMRQWTSLKEYANSKNVKIMGDVPLYLSYDSVEMWKLGNKIFKVDKNKKMSDVAGCPPDAFSEDGQLWGNPLYNYHEMKKDGYKWWNERLEYARTLYDIVRLDHFRGFDRYYAVPYGDKNAKNGRWLCAPSFDLFKDKLDWDIVAEDLGVLDRGVYRLMERTNFAGMREIIFAFDDRKENEHKPSNYKENCVCYTSTHDNEPLTAYIIEQFKDKKKRKIMLDALQSECQKVGIKAVGWAPEVLCDYCIELAYASKANTVIIPLWDMLNLGEDARINLPGTTSNKNWSWRAKDEYLCEPLKKYLLALSKKYNR